jgi:hypothetical protein
MFFVALVVVLIVGDFLSTFLYHVPQHIWGKLHLRTHHDRSRSYWDHAEIGQAHVWWRHTTEIGWKSPPALVRFARTFGLVLPEDHDGHHRNPDIEFGDLFRFYDVPARAMLAYVRGVQRRRRNALKRLQRIRAIRMVRRQAQQA